MTTKPNAIGGTGRVKKIIGLFLLMAAVNVQAETTGASWLLMPTDARSAALAGATGAWSEGAESLGTNPAGLADTNGTDALFTHAFWAQNVSREHLGVAHRMGDKWSLGLSADYVGYGSIDSYTVVNGVPVANGTLKPNDLAVGLGGGVKLSQAFSVGAQVKMLREDLGGVKGSAAAGDIGGSFTSKDMKIALSVVNVGDKLNEASLPTTGSLAASYKLHLAETTKNGKAVQQNLGIMAQGDLGLIDSNQNAFSAGAEFRYAELLAVRVGYRGAKVGDLTGLSGLTVGVGVTVKKMEVSYALVTMGDFGKSSLVSLKAGF